MARYTLYQTGPDNRSTYAECWGSQSKSPGTLIAQSSTLTGLAEAVGSLDHDNWWICGPGGLYIAGSRKEYYQLPAVVKATAKA